MRISLFLSLLAWVSSAAAWAARKYYPDQLVAVVKQYPFINGLTVNAIDGYFSFGYSAATDRGAGPTTSCPQYVTPCPPGNATAVICSRDQAALDTEVPGGQYIFFDKRGYMAYGAPHAGIIPRHASATGFSIEGPTGDDPRGRFHFNGTTARGFATGFVACPEPDYGPPFTIMAKHTTFWRDHDPNHECFDVELALQRYDFPRAAAWQYDVGTVR